MKSIFTPKTSASGILLILLVTAIRGQITIDAGVEDRTCSEAEISSTQPRSTSDFGLVRQDPLRAFRAATTCDVSKNVSLGDESKSSNPFEWEDPSSATHDPQAQADDAQELAKKLSNPIASLISFPFQNNFDFGMGPERKGYRYTLNIQPVIPFALTKDINVISRTILPVIAQEDVVGTTGQFGLGDTIQSFFFSPNKTEPFIWGVGPQILIPTATNQYLGSQKFGLGPTLVVLKQQKNWTYGALVNHTWSVFGKDSRPPVNSTFLQPFLSYTTKNAWTFAFNTESAYDWSGDVWNVPIHFQVSKLIKMGKQPVSVGIGSRCWAVSGPGGPQGCGFRLVFVPLFPVK